MLEGYLSNLLANKFGHWIKDFDKDHVHISAWNGEVSLKNLLIKTTALDAYEDIPVDVAYGKIGELEMRIPWNSFRSEPTSVVLTDLELLITPRVQKKKEASVSNEEERDEKGENTASAKEEEVQSVLNAKVLQQSISATGRTSRVARFLMWVSSTLFSNLSVTVRNIHIRYEDTGTSFGFVWNERSFSKSFAVGITLRQFSVQNTREPTKQETAPQNTTEYTIQHKHAAIYQLAVYWDQENPLIASRLHHNLNSDEQRVYAQDAFQQLRGDDNTATTVLAATDFATNFDHRNIYTNEHSYLLKPISPSLEFSLVQRKEEVPSAVTIPPSSVKMTLPSCKLGISRRILEDVVYLRKSIATWQKAQSDRLLRQAFASLAAIRPDSSIHDDAPAWWRYAFQAALLLSDPERKRRRHRGWLALLTGVQNRRRYIDLYRRLLNESEAGEVHKELTELEDELDVDEIVCFRLAAYEALVEQWDENTQLEKVGSKKDANAQLPNASLEFTLELRKDHLFASLNILQVGRSRMTQLDPAQKTEQAEQKQQPLLWTASLVCPEVSLEVRESRKSSVVRLSFAYSQRQQIKSDGSWALSSHVADLRMLDLTNNLNTRLYSALLGPKSLENTTPTSNNDFVEINGEKLRCCIQIKIQRDFHRRENRLGSTTCTTARLNPLEVVFSSVPMTRLMGIFSTIKTPEMAEDYERMAFVVSRWQQKQRDRLLVALAHKEKKIVVDIDVSAPVFLVPEDPMRHSCQMLVIDFGRLHFGNQDASDLELQLTGFDDSWKLLLTNMQVQNCSSSDYRLQPQTSIIQNAGTLAGRQQIVEPFSLEFLVLTKIASGSSTDKNAETNVKINASLPRLAFNFSSSSIRLVSLLNRRWQKATNQPVPSQNFTDQNGSPPKLRQLVRRFSSHREELERQWSRGTLQTSPWVRRFNTKGTTQTKQVFEFLFSAPLIALELTNDVDSKKTDLAEAPIVSVACRGLGGTLVHKDAEDGSKRTCFDAKMKSVEAIDLYQEAGPEFALLLSSDDPEYLLSRQNDNPDFSWTDFFDSTAELEARDGGGDIVSVQYEKQVFPKQSHTYRSENIKSKSRVQIDFHELYVEWNPETLAAIQDALKVPDTADADAGATFVVESTQEKRTSIVRTSDDASSDDEFFDAKETDSLSCHSAYEDGENDGSEVGLLSEIESASSSAEVQAYFDDTWIARPGTHRGGWAGVSQVLDEPLPPAPTEVASKSDENENENENEAEKKWEPFDLKFELVKLRVAFNKETRHRRLIIADMDRTSIHFSRRLGGGSQTLARMGNLTMTDPDFAESASTLYSEILGLKTDVSTGSAQASSLLQLELYMNPRSRTFVSSQEQSNNSTESETKQSVRIDKAEGSVFGCDYFVDLKFSPMRFVYLQQLWFEVIDYFFEGIMGYEVWGYTRPQNTGIEHWESILEDERVRLESLPFLNRGELPGADAKGFSFTRFDISLSGPTVLLPVTYRSPQFLRLDCSSISLSNRYSSHVQLGQEVERDSMDLHIQDRVQWFNNCNVAIENITLQSWNGQKLTGSKMDVTRDANLKISWPTGPVSVLIMPKWRISCDTNEIEVNLQAEDYALFQNIVQFNIGELSRHLEEWRKLQQLPKEELVNLKEKIMVHYGYDVKDTAPSTYEVTMKMPSVALNLMAGQSSEVVIAQTKCVNLSWSMKKFSDCISRQHISCEVVLSKPTQIGPVIDLLLPTGESSSESQFPQLLYSSTTAPSGDNVKSLEISDACINLVYPIWMEIADFFSGLATPLIMSHEEVKSAIQVGDRWYVIGPSSSKENESLQPLDSYRTPDIPNPSYQFRLLLVNPRIVLNVSDLDDDDTSVILWLRNLDYFHLNCNNIMEIKRTFFVHDLELYTATSKKAYRQNDFSHASLIRPWSAIGMLQRCNSGSKETCQKHSLELRTEVVKARAAYSDMSVAIDVLNRFVKDISRPGKKKGQRAPNRKSLEDAKLVSSEESTEVEAGSCSQTLFTVSTEVGGLEIVVVDDSQRHFALAQDLIGLYISEITFCHKSERMGPDIECKTASSLDVSSIDLIDCLQSPDSPFYLAATTTKIDQHSNVSAELGKRAGRDRLDFDRLRTKAGTWGFFIPNSWSQALCVSKDSRPKAIVYRGESDRALSSKHSMKILSFSMQWNPSTVIALQRFLGRLSKEAKVTFSRDEQSTSTAAAALDSSVEKGSLEAEVAIENLSISLNKEHQNRRLLHATLTNSKLSVSVDAAGSSTFRGSVKNIEASDEDNYGTKPGGIRKENKSILRVTEREGSESDQDFLSVHFQVFAKEEKVTSGPPSLPNWVKTVLASADDNKGGIDDYLQISVASVQFIYLRERTEELIDYLSNGLPGKGMGATSKAAKGFINNRIQKRSFIDLAISAPEVQIPMHENEGKGVQVRLGDAHLRTWFESDGSQSADNAEWRRVLSLSILGLGWNIYGTTQVDAWVRLPVDLHMQVKKPTTSRSTLAIRGKLSFVRLTLKYSEYELLQGVLKKNIGRTINVESWDNVEKAFWMEEAKSQSGDMGDTVKTVKVQYSSNARFVRYGQKRAAKKKEKAILKNNDFDPNRNDYGALDFQFTFEGIHMTLHRDDSMDDGPLDVQSQFNYDIVLLRVQRVEVAASISSSKEKSLKVLLYRVDLFDMGDLGRLARREYFRNLDDLRLSPSERKKKVKPLRYPSAFSMIAEGHPTQSEEQTSGEDEHPQLAITMNTRDASSLGTIGSLTWAELGPDKITVVSVVLNYLTVNAMIRPLREVVDFLNGAWSKGSEKGATFARTSAREQSKPADLSPAPEDPSSPRFSNSGLQVKLVAHYPRVFFVADESDSHSRALVLRGLAVVDASLFKQRMATGQISNPSSHWPPKEWAYDDNEQVVAVAVQLHRMETYIHPDVSSILSESTAGGDFSPMNSPTGDQSSLGVALIEPVTAGMEFFQVSRDRFPTLRNITIRMEPVSTMLSFDDLTLINTVSKRWSSNKQKFQADHSSQSSEEEPARQFSVTFSESKLGLVLKNNGGGVVVEGTQDDGSQLSVRRGDRIVSVNGKSIEGHSLSSVARQLSQTPRPLVVSFIRQDLDESNYPSRQPAPDHVHSTPAVVKGSAAPLESVGEEKKEDVSVTFCTKLRLGKPNGLTLKQSQIGNFAVVTEVDYVALSEVLVVDSYENTSSLNVQSHSLPRPGALLVGINEKTASELGFEQTDQILRELNAPNRDIDDDIEETYQLSFLEVHSSHLGSIDRMNASISGITLTFIDDFNGRDMPLVRGRVSAIDFRAERGMGLRPGYLDDFETDVFLTFLDSIGVSVHNPSCGDTYDWESERVVRLSSFCQMEMDYFHPKIAMWEPLVERSTLASLVEWQKGCVFGNMHRLGRLAVRLSDTYRNSGAVSESKVCTVNLTDAAIHVLSRTLSEAKNWRNADRLHTNVESSAPQEAKANDEGKPRLDSLPSDSSSLPRPPNQAGKDRPKVEAVREAAQAALAFATRRGVAHKMKGETAKPFIFRNRVGLPLVFRQQRTQKKRPGSSGSLANEEALVEQVSRPGKDSRFELNLFSQDSFSSDSSKKIRSYEGQFPSLEVELQPEGQFCFELLSGLQVSRVGTFRRFLRLAKKDEPGSYELPVLWQVELEDNRRVLTLSSAVQVVSVGLDTAIEVGYRQHESDTAEPLGFSSPGSPLFVPIWLGIRHNHVSILVRPHTGESETYCWSDESIIRSDTSENWVSGWQPCFSTTLAVPCRSAPSSDGQPLFLLCQTAPVLTDTNSSLQSVENVDSTGLHPCDPFSVLIDSTLTIRNLLPISVDLEVINRSPVELGKTYVESFQSGQGIDLFGVDLTKAMASLRVRCRSDLEWTSWATLVLPKSVSKSVSAQNEGEQEDGIGIEASSQVVVYTQDEFSCSLPIGVRLIPKIDRRPTSETCYGFEVVLHAELWFANQTGLPLTFGCPVQQLDSQSEGEGGGLDEQSLESMGRAAAEAALNEIASVFELGDRGREFGGLSSTRQIDVHTIPFQHFGETTVEIFEYIEVESSTVKRRWWASRLHDSPRPNPFSLSVGSCFSWIEDSWQIDKSGHQGGSRDGWESCSSLSGRKELYFSPNRTFSSSHRFRRRRWLRRLKSTLLSRKLLPGVDVFLQPSQDFFCQSRENLRNRENEDKVETCFNLKYGSGQWSSAARVPASGAAEGIIKVLAASWPSQTGPPQSRIGADSNGILTHRAFDLCYNVAEIPGDWGEFTRMVTITPRYFLRNDSTMHTFEVKQAGQPDQTAIRVPPGNVTPFYWSDSRLPELVAVRPVGENVYGWSGGFDITAINSIPLRIRSRQPPSKLQLSSIKAVTELRPRSSGMNISFTEEDVYGNGALFQIENLSPFPIWVVQDGILANPTALSYDQESKSNDVTESLTAQQWTERSPEVDGDLIQPRTKRVFALDVPYRQGKYAGRKAASMSELFRTRVSLAPLSTRIGIERMKVVCLTNIGETVRLNPSKLLPLSSRKDQLTNIRVMGVISTDGPTHVLQFRLILKDSPSAGLSQPPTEHTRDPSHTEGNLSTGMDSKSDPLQHMLLTAAEEAIAKRTAEQLPTETQARRDAFFNSMGGTKRAVDLYSDIRISFKASFDGLVFSLVDSAPSEIAVISLKRIDIVANWTALRTTDASVILSIEWLQVDNHVPNAPFPVAICPELGPGESTDSSREDPLLMVGLLFAPQHQTGFICLRSVTVALRNFAIAVDLAFIVRLQRLFSGFQASFVSPVDEGMNNHPKHYMSPPDLSKTSVLEAGRYGKGSTNMYFEGLTILPVNVNLSVAAVRVLSQAQAVLEGAETAAIHTAVRRGDILLADGSLGVKVGRKNRTPIAVVRGVFKSIVVDALLRCNGASLNLGGVMLRNHVSNGQQLKTYLTAHYLAALRTNVPALLGSLSAFGNPAGLIRGLGDGVSDFVTEPVKGLKRSVEELDPVHVVDGVARGTGSLARHTVGGIAGSASMLTETFSKNLAVLALDRRYAHKRDMTRRELQDDFTFVEGVESGVAHIIQGFVEGVAGVVRAPLRGAERSGVKGFAKGVGKGLLGLLVKPLIGLTDAATDVMIGVKVSVDGGKDQGGVSGVQQLRPRRALYGSYKTIQEYSFADAAAATLLMRTQAAGEPYLDHLDMNDRVILISTKHVIMLGPAGQELVHVHFKDVNLIDLVPSGDESDVQWSISITLVRTADESESESVKLLACGGDRQTGEVLLEKIERGRVLFESQLLDP